ncbi:hypothetical protein ABW21_db0202078 [Orbilia brochopaga]|nr:hypothetical protein ABW21_db0202078 [Drechslerella brochopaga]
MPLGIKFPSVRTRKSPSEITPRDRKSVSAGSHKQRTSSEEDRSRHEFKCPQCSHTVTPPFRGGSGDSGKLLNPVLSGLGFDFSPIPIIVISPTSKIEHTNKIATTLFSYLDKVYGGLNGLDIGELGVEFQDQRWVTLGMVVDRRRARYIESFGSRFGSPVGAHDKRDFEEGPNDDHPDTPSPRSKFVHSPDLGGLGRRAADALRGKNKSTTKESASDGISESFEVMIRFPKGQAPQYQTNNSRRESTGKPSSNRRHDDTEKQSTMLVPATLFLSFTDSGSEVYTIMSILTHDSIGVASSGRNSRQSEVTRELIVPGNMRLATEFASKAERVRDSTLEHLDSHFIAMNTRGDLTITNSSTRKFFGLEQAMPDIGIGRTTSEWVSRLNFYDPKFSTSTSFTEYFHQNLRRRTTTFKDNIGVYVKDTPKLMEISGLPLYAVNTPWVKDLDREFVGYLIMFRDITKQREIDAAHQQDERLRGIFTSGVVSELRT